MDRKEKSSLKIHHTQLVFSGFNIKHWFAHCKV